MFNGRHIRWNIQHLHSFRSFDSFQTWQLHVSSPLSVVLTRWPATTCSKMTQNPPPLWPAIFWSKIYWLYCRPTGYALIAKCTPLLLQLFTDRVHHQVLEVRKLPCYILVPQNALLAYSHCPISTLLPAFISTPSTFGRAWVMWFILIV